MAFVFAKNREILQILFDTDLVGERFLTPHVAERTSFVFLAISMHISRKNAILASAFLSIVCIHACCIINAAFLDRFQ